MQKEEQRFCNLGRIDGETTILNRLDWQKEFYDSYTNRNFSFVKKNTNANI